MARSSTPYWRKNLRIVVLLLSIWALVSLGLGVVFVEPLNEIQVGGFKLGFWFAQQGSIYVFVVLIAVYAVWLDRIEKAMRDESKGGAE